MIVLWRHTNWDLKISWFCNMVFIWMRECGCNMYVHQAFSIPEQWLNGPLNTLKRAYNLSTAQYYCNTNLLSISCTPVPILVTVSQCKWQLGVKVVWEKGKKVKFVAAATVYIFVHQTPSQLLGLAALCLKWSLILRLTSFHKMQDKKNPIYVSV